MSLAQARRVPREIYASALQHTERLGRVLRMDPPEWLGTSTQWFVRSAFEAGDSSDALELARYERAEFRRLEDTVLGGWVTALFDFLESHGSSLGQRAPDRILRTHLWERLGLLAEQAVADLEAAIGNMNAALFDSAQRQLREVHIASNDLTVRLVQDLLTEIQATGGDEAVLEAHELSYQRIWKPRYEAWFELTGHERLALSCEGMRVHYGGPGRYGDFLVVEREGDYLMRFDPCGTGQVMRRGDSERDPEPYIGPGPEGRARTAAPWNQNTAGMPLYCAHCPILLEYFPMRDFAAVLRPVLFDADPMRPCGWVVPKDKLPAAAA